MSEPIPEDIHERLAACICWGEFASPRTDTPYEYWQKVTNRDTFLASAADVLAPHGGEMWWLAGQMAMVVARMPYEGALTDLRVLANRVLAITALERRAAPTPPDQSAREG